MTLLVPCDADDTRLLRRPAAWRGERGGIADDPGIRHQGGHWYGLRNTSGLGDACCPSSGGFSSPLDAMLPSVPVGRLCPLMSRQVAGLMWRCSRCCCNGGQPTTSNPSVTLMLMLWLCQAARSRGASCAAVIALAAASRRWRPRGRRCRSPPPTHGAPPADSICAATCFVLVWASTGDCLCIAIVVNYIDAGCTCSSPRVYIRRLRKSILPRAFRALETASSGIDAAEKDDGHSVSVLVPYRRRACPVLKTPKLQ